MSTSCKQDFFLDRKSSHFDGQNASVFVLNTKQMHLVSPNYPCGTPTSSTGNLGERVQQRRWHIPADSSQFFFFSGALPWPDRNWLRLVSDQQRRLGVLEWQLFWYSSCWTRTHCPTLKTQPINNPDCRFRFTQQMAPTEFVKRLTADFLVLVLSIFDGAHIQCGSVRKDHSPRFLKKR